MNEIYLTIGFLITVIIGLLCVGLRNYVNEKLKNLATTQDIGNITKEVEGVKQTFTVLTNKHNILFQEEKEALVAYLAAWNVWFGSLKSAEDFHRLMEYQVMRDKIEKYNTDYDNVQTAMSKLELFLNNDAILSAAANLNLETFEIQRTTEGTVQSMYNHYQKLAILEQKGTKEELELAKKEMIETVGHYTKTVRPMFQKASAQTRTEFIKLSKAYIRKDI